MDPANYIDKLFGHVHKLALHTDATVAKDVQTLWDGFRKDAGLEAEKPAAPAEAAAASAAEEAEAAQPGKPAAKPAPKK